MNTRTRSILGGVGMGIGIGASVGVAVGNVVVGLMLMMGLSVLWSVVFLNADNADSAESD